MIIISCFECYDRQRCFELAVSAQTERGCYEYGVYIIDFRVYAEGVSLIEDISLKGQKRRVVRVAEPGEDLKSAGLCLPRSDHQPPHLDNNFEQHDWRKFQFPEILIEKESRVLTSRSLVIERSIEDVRIDQGQLLGDEEFMRQQGVDRH